LEHKEELRILFERYKIDQKALLEPSITPERLRKFYLDEQNERHGLDSCGMVVIMASSFVNSEYGNLKKLIVESPNVDAIEDITMDEYFAIALLSERKLVNSSYSIITPKGINIRGFSNMILSKSNYVSIDRISKTRLVNPLSHYYINTSHYTYLSFDPYTFSFNLSAKNYSTYLLQGVRCVDISLIVREIFLIEFYRMVLITKLWLDIKP
jgi:hypothetical protein